MTVLCVKAEGRSVKTVCRSEPTGAHIVVVLPTRPGVGELRAEADSPIAGPKVGAIVGPMEVP